MLRVRLILPCFLANILLSGCDLSTNTSIEKKLEATNEQIAKLQVEVDNLKWKQEFQQSDGTLAYLTPGSDGYSTIKFDLGVLTVQLDDVKPYANGSKVTLRFGNNLAASINGLTATIEWGKVTEKGMPIAGKLKEVTFKEKLRPASWTPISVVLDGIPPNELGYVRVYGVSHKGIQLYK